MLTVAKGIMGKVLFAGPVFSVEEFDVLVEGKRRKFIRLLENSSSIVLPLLKDGRIIMERQYRHAIGRWIYELPAGHIEKGESPKEAAARELKEETGYNAKSMNLLFRTYELPDLTAASRHYYIASGLTKGKRALEPTEQIDLVTLRLEKALSMIDSGAIKDPCTIAGILYYSRKRGWL